MGLVGGRAAVFDHSRQRGIVVAQLRGDRCQVCRPGLDRIRRLGLTVEHRGGLVYQRRQRVQVGVGVDGNLACSLDDSRQFRSQPSDRDKGFVDCGLQVVVRDRLQTAVCFVEQRIDGGGTEVSSMAMTSPSFSGAAEPSRGNSATYCSPSAD